MKGSRHGVGSERFVKKIKQCLFNLVQELDLVGKFIFSVPDYLDASLKKGKVLKEG